MSEADPAVFMHEMSLVSEAGHMIGTQMLPEIIPVFQDDIEEVLPLREAAVLLGSNGYVKSRTRVYRPCMTCEAKRTDGKFRSNECLDCGK